MNEQKLLVLNSHFFQWMHSLNSYCITLYLCSRVVQNSIFLQHQKDLDKLIHWFKKYCLFSVATQAKDRKRNVAITYFSFSTNNSWCQKKIAYDRHAKKVWTDSHFICNFQLFSFKLNAYLSHLLQYFRFFHTTSTAVGVSRYLPWRSEKNWKLCTSRSQNSAIFQHTERKFTSFLAKMITKTSDIQLNTVTSTERLLQASTWPQTTYACLTENHCSDFNSTVNP